MEEIVFRICQKKSIAEEFIYGMNASAETG